MTYSAFQGNNVADGSRTPSQDYATRYATALKLFSGEVFNAFNDATIFKGLVRNYSLRGGKSKQFLLTGKLAAGYHTPGEAIAPAAGLKSNEKTIVMDDLLVSSQFVYDLDEILSSGPAAARSPSKSVKLWLCTMTSASLACSPRRSESSVVTGEPGGFEVNIGAGNTNDAQSIVDGFFEAAAVLDERSAPSDGRCAVLSPRQYYSLISSVDTNILNREIGNTQGDMNSGKGLYSIAGIRIYKSNVLAGLYGQTKTAGAGENNDYAVDCSALAGLVFHQVKLPAPLRLSLLPSKPPLVISMSSIRAT